ncbi:MAG: ATP-binding cassette domain-containing protein [Chloroflexi bacterium]|nr:ATP-binding cassette domain-containing protein [Chloroflexota bacterium]
MSKTIDTRRVLIFLGFAFGISWAVALYLYLSGGIVDSPQLLPGISVATALIATIYMWSPALANVFTRLVTKEGWKNTWLPLQFEGRGRFWLLAWLLPPLLTFVGAGIYFLVFPEHFDPTFTFMRQTIATYAAQGNPLPLAPEILVLIQLAQAILLAPVINSLFTFGEEFGWRAYLQPKLLPLGYRRGLLATGAIWGLWHAPLIAMGLNYGFDYAGFPWAGMLGMIIFTMATGVVFGWLTIQGKSVWPAVIAHATINGLAASAILFTHPDAITNDLLGPLPIGILGGLPWILLAVWLLQRGDPRADAKVSRETSPPRASSPSAKSMIFAQGLTKSFGEVLAVDGLDLDIPSGEVFGLLGPNGAGKTTTIRMLTALIEPSAGQAVVAGHRLGDEDNLLRKDVGILTETPGMYQQISAERNLAFFAELYDVEDISGQVERYLRMLGLWGRRSEPVGTFSKGMRQKLAIARALLHEPKVLFLDEPTAGLDPEASKIVREFVSELRSEGRTIVLTTHNLDEADRLCDRIAVFRTSLLALDSPTNLRRQLYGRAVVFHFEALNPAFAEAMEQKSFVREVKTVDNKLVVTLDDPEKRNPELVRELVGLGAELQFVGELRQSLEDVYLQLVRGKGAEVEV